MGSVLMIDNDVHYRLEVNSAGNKLIVVAFTASWCGPCLRMAPVLEQLSEKYPRAVFMKVDVDKCKETATSLGVSSMPTFIFYRSKTRLETVNGAEPNVLENKIKQYYGSGDGEEGEELVDGHMDLLAFILKPQCESLNESDDHPLAHCLTSEPGFLESDVDKQLIINMTFSQAVKVHSLKIKAPQDKGPKTIKLFINQPNTLDFDKADSNEAVQELNLTPEDVEGNPINLKFVKFQNVQNLQIFVKDNLKDTETTQIDYLALFGSPKSTLNMGEFKRVTGKKGECH